MSEERLKQIAAKKPILTPPKQRVVWARVTAVKKILIEHGLTTEEEFEGVVSGMVRDIDKKVENGIRKKLGLIEEE